MVIRMAEINGVRIKEYERLDDLQCKGLRLIQDPERFCFGMDAVLLSDFVKAGPKDIVLDMCTGNGIIPTLLSAKTRAKHIYGLEIQPEAVDLAKRSVALNGLGQRVEIVQGDIKEIGSYFPKASINVVTCNPPYMIEQHGVVNEADHKTIARHEILCNLEDVVAAAAQTVRPGGNFYMVHRPFRLAEIIVMLTKYKLEPKRMRLVYPFIDKEPNMVLIEATRGGKSRMTVEKPLIVYNSPGEYTDEIYEIYGRHLED